MNDEVTPKWHEAIVGERRVRYLMVGTGDPVVLLHGLSGSARWWHRNLAALAAHFQVFAVELFSLTDRWSPRFDLARSTDGIAEWMTTLGLPQSSFIGHSMGGHMVARLAAKNPERVKRLVLVNAATFFPVSGRKLDPVRVLQWLPSLPLSLAPVLTRDALRAGPFSLWRTSRDLLASDLRDTVTEIVSPTLIVWGDRDGLLPVELAYELHAAIPCSRLHVFSRVGHNPMWEVPDAFNALVTSFLKS
jgi:pimeloyl-ACP methyl ester carboxylesterase